MDIAVIGISCRFPTAENKEVFWQNLISSANCVSKADTRWNVQEYKSLAGEDFSHASVSTGIVPEIDKFDHQFFQISPKEAKHMDPQQRLLLEETWKCIEDSGIPMNNLKEQLTSVYVGCMGLDYYQNVHEEGEIDGYCASGVFPHLLSGRISFFFDLKGKSQTIDTACSSSLSALDNAAKELQAGHANYSIVAGVNLNVNPSRNVMWLRNRMLSSDGLCKSFDATADGFVSGDGIACVLLQPYEDAIRDHNHIYGIIKGINVVHGGKTVSLTAPSADAQTRLICGTYDQVDFKADVVNYIETHGSGTSLGDPIEVESLTRSYRTMTDKKQFCYLGTVKSNIGHLEAASGMAAFIKVLMMMKYHQIPPTLNVTRPNPIIDFKHSPFMLADQLREWKASNENEPLRAGVNSFGLAGVSAHVLLEEYIEKPNKTKEEPQVFLLSAKTKKSLLALLQQWEKFVETKSFEQISLSDVCKTLAVGRVHFTYRTGTIVTSKEEIKAFIRERAIDEIKECRPEIYTLFLGDLSYESALRLYDQYRNVSIFEQDQLIDTLIQAQDEESKKLCILLIQQAICNLLSKLGFTYEKIYGTNIGSISMLVQAGCCERKEAMDLLKQQWDISKFKRPKMPLFCQLEQKFLYPNDVTRQYVELCLEGTKEELNKIGMIDLWQENFDDYFERAALLLQYQYTFKRYMEEWEASMSYYAKVSFADILNETAQMPGKSKNLAKKFLMIIIIDCLCKVYGKWKLSEETLSENASCYEVSKLLEDGVIGKEDLCKYYLSDHSDFDLILEKINAYHKQLTEENGYKILYRLEQSKEDIESYVRSMVQEMNATVMMETSSDYVLVSIQSNDELPKEQCIHIGSYHTINELLLALWSRGVMIPWEKVYQNQEFQKVVLPVYQFQGNSCWITHTGSFTSRNRQLDEKPMESKSIPLYEEEETCSIWKETIQPISIEAGTLDQVAFLVISEDARFCKEFYEKNEKVSQRMIVLSKKQMQPYQSMEQVSLKERVGSEYQHALELMLPVKTELVVIFDWNSFESMDAIEVLNQMHMFYQALYQCRKTKDVKILSIVSGTKNRESALALGSLFRNVNCENKGIHGLNLILSQNESFKEKTTNASMACERFAAVYELDFKNGITCNSCYGLIEEQQETLSVKKDGVYIITGGVGGLGRAIAKWLIRNEQLHLILVGRNSLNEKIQMQLNELMQYGSEVEYICADVSSKEETSIMIKDILKRYSRIYGIFHAAGTYKTGFFVQKTEKTIATVTEGKMKGAANLDECTKDIELDFFVLISSVSAMVGDVGISDYAYANGYLNVLARKREQLRKKALRKGNTYSIALPILLDGGIILNEIAKEQYVKQTGFDLVKKDVAVNSIIDIVKKYQSGVYVIGHGDTEKIGEKLMNNKSKDFLSMEEQKRMSTSELIEQVEEFVKEIFAEEFDMDKQDLDVNESLQEYGIDSIIIQRFNKILAKDITDVSKTILFECSNIKQVAEYLLENYYDVFQQKFDSEMKEEQDEVIEVVQEESVSRNESVVRNESVSRNESTSRNESVCEKNNLVAKTSVAMKESDTLVLDEHKDKSQLRNEQTTNHQLHDEQEDGYAIIGISGRFPGADNIEEFWRNLKQGVDSITDIPKERWNSEEYLQDYFYCKKGGFLTNVKQFDAEFFHISAREAIHMDPQERLMLETSWNVLEDAGYTTQKLEDMQREVGVFVGAAASSYQMIAMDEWNKGNIEVPNTRSWAISNRISYFMNLTGPSMTIDSACSSSLSALKLAINSIKLNECKAAIVGGVNLIMHPAEYAFRGRMHMLSEEGHCNSFGKQADGYVPGEGVTAIMIKPVHDAVRDHDRIYGVIRGIAINHGGRTNGFTVPNPNAQADLILKAAKDANIDLKKLSYIEAHGTGTALGDPIEVEGLTKAFKHYDALGGKCSLGTVKSNIGHLEAVSGIAGIIKVLLQMQHNELVPSLHAEELNPDIRFNNGPFYVQRNSKQWMEDATEHCFAGVSSFGAGGTNVHVILSNYPEMEESEQENMDRKSYLIPVSARNEESLKRAAKVLMNFVEKVETVNESKFLTSLSYTLLTGRENFNARLAFFASDLGEVKTKLEDYLDNGEQAKGCFIGHDKNPYQVLLSGDEGQAFVRSIIANQSKDKLAMIWSMGFELEWKVLGEQNDARIISIPSYALNPKPYWIGTHPVKMNQKEQSLVDSNPSAVSYEKSKVEQVGPYQNDIEELVRKFVGETLFVEPEEIDMEYSLYDLGLDSILGVQLVKSINQEFHIEMSATNIYDYPNVRQLSEYIRSQIDKSKVIQSNPETIASENRDVNTSRIQVSTVPVEKKGESNRQKISDELIRMVSDVLFIEPSDVDITDSLYDLGLDSILGVELVKRINKQYAISMQASDIYTYVNIKDMADYIVANRSDCQTEYPRCVSLDDSVKQIEDTKKEKVELTQSYDVSEYEYQLIGGANKVELQSLKKEQQVNFKECSKLDTQSLLYEVNLSKQNNQEEVTNQEAVVNKDKAFNQGKFTNQDEVAIVGMSGRFPGADTIEEFWKMLLDGKNSVTVVPKNRFEIESYYKEKQGELGSTYCRMGGFLKNAYHFDPTFFRISPVEAERMNPQQRLFLEEAWHTIEDAGYAPSSLGNKKCGVYVGTSIEDYKIGFVGQQEEADVMGLLGNNPSFLPSRISYFLNLKGPAVAFDTACSSSLTAIHHAVMGIRNGDCDMALAGGTTIINDVNLYLTTAHGKMLSSSGQCHAFSEDADGFVPSEGVVVFMLKRLSQAEKDKDHIYGIIKGNAINQDGRSNGITAPSAISQEMLEKEVFETYQIDPGKITYVEAHGTGTKLGDPIEFKALTNAFRAYTPKESYCAIGSVKSNMGHSLACSGAVGIAKILLCLQHKALVPEIEPKRQNSLLEVAGSPFYFNVKKQDWTVESGEKRMASVSSFGLSGTNCYMVLEEYVESVKQKQRVQLPYYVFFISGKSKWAAKKNLYRLMEWVKDYAQTEQIGDVAYTLASGREHFEYRIAIVARDYKELCQIIESETYEIHQAKLNSGTILGTVNNKYVVNEIEGAKEIAELYLSGQAMEIEKLYDNYDFRRVSLPGYAFEEEEYRIQPKKERLRAVQNQPSNDISNDLSNEPKVSLPPDLFYKNVWDMTEVAHTFDDGKAYKIALYTEDADDLVTQMEARNAIDSKMNFSELDIEKLQEQFVRKDSITIYLLCMSRKKPSDSEIMKQQEVLSCCQKLFQILKPRDNKIKLVLATNQCQQVFLEDEVIPNMAAIIGFMKVAMKELPNIDISMLDVSKGELEKQNKETLIQLLGMQTGCKKGEEFAYRKGKYYIKHLQQIKKPEITKQGFREHGVYVILGGAGRIGSEMALYLAKRYHATLILLGRSKENNAIINSMERIGQAGGKACYYSVDTTNYVALSGVVKAVEQEFGRIHGVIHSAIYYKTSLILEQSEGMLTEVTKPKIPATHQLARVFVGKDLDFFLYFSSGDAYTALIGHSAYVAGSIYEDCYAIYQAQQESYPVKVLNWGFWESSQQQKERLDADGRTSDYAYLDGLKSRGIQLITADIGTTAVDLFVSCEESQMYVMMIDDTIKNHFDMKCIETKEARSQNLAGLKEQLMQLEANSNTKEQEKSTMLKKLGHRLHSFE